jgi:hypothetical protein
MMVDFLHIFPEGLIPYVLGAVFTFVPTFTSCLRWKFLVQRLRAGFLCFGLRRAFIVVPATVSYFANQG